MEINSFDDGKLYAFNKPEFNNPMVANKLFDAYKAME